MAGLHFEEFAEGQVNETIARELTGLHATTAVPVS